MRAYKADAEITRSVTKPTPPPYLFTLSFKFLTQSTRLFGTHIVVEPRKTQSELFQEPSSANPHLKIPQSHNHDLSPQHGGQERLSGPRRWESSCRITPQPTHHCSDPLHLISHISDFDRPPDVRQRLRQVRKQRRILPFSSAQIGEARYGRYISDEKQNHCWHGSLQRSNDGNICLVVGVDMEVLARWNSAATIKAVLSVGDL